MDVNKVRLRFHTRLSGTVCGVAHHSSKIGWHVELINKLKACSTEDEKGWIILNFLMNVKLKIIGCGEETFRV